MKEIKKIRVAAYLRVSTSEQAKEGYGLDTQLRHIQNEIAKFELDGWELSPKHIYKDEGFSGAMESRPAFQNMLQDAKNKKFDIILSFKIDRLSRSLRLLLETMEKLGEYGVDYKSVTEPFDTSAVGKLIFRIFGALSEFERDLIMTRTQEGKIDAANQGRYVGGGIPLGFKVKNKKIIVDRNEAKIIHKIFSWFLDLDYSIEKIADTLSKRKIKTKSDRIKGNHRTKNPMCYWHGSAIRTILKNEKYIGIWYYNRFGKNKKGKKVEKPKEEWIKLNYPAIIDKKTFYKAKEKLAESKKRSNNANTLYLLSGKIICSECGSTYTGYTSSKGTKNYRCNKNANRKAIKKCKSSHISEKKLATPVWSQVKKFLQYPNQEFKKIAKALRKNTYYTKLLDERDQIIQKLNSYADTRKRVRDAFRNKIYTQEELKEELEIIDNSVIELKDQLNEVNSQLTFEDAKKEKIQSAKELKKRYKENLSKCDYKDKYKILQALVNKIQIKNNAINVELKIPKKIQKAAEKENKLKSVNGGR